MDALTTERYAGKGPARHFKRLKPVKRQPWTPIRSHCCGRGGALSHCCGLVVAFACGRARGMDALTTERYAGKRPARHFKRLKPVKRQPWTPIRSHCCGRGDALSHCCGLVVAFACGRARGMDALTTERYAGKGPARHFRGFKRLKPVKRQCWNSRQPWTPIRSHCCGRGVLLSHCCGLLMAFAFSVGVAKVQERQDLRRGKGSRKTGSTPPVVPGAAPALAKARVGGYIYIYIYIYTSSDDNLECSRSTFALDFDVRTCWMIRRLWPRGCCKDWARLLQLCCAMLRSVVSEFPVVSPGRRTFPLPFADASLGSKAGGCCDLEKHIKASSMSMHISDIYAQCDNISIYSIFRQTNLQTERQMHVPTWIGQHVIWHTVPCHTIYHTCRCCAM